VGVIFKTITVSLHRERFVVVHLYSTFSVNPQKFPLGANRDFGGSKATFSKSQR